MITYLSRSLDLIAYGVAMFLLLMLVALLDELGFLGDWSVPTRTAARGVAFGLPAFLLALMAGRWWAGFVAGPAIFLTYLLGSMGDLERFRDSNLPFEAARWYRGYEYWSPPLAAATGLGIRRGVSGTLGRLGMRVG